MVQAKIAKTAQRLHNAERVLVLLYPYPYLPFPLDPSILPVPLFTDHTFTTPFMLAGTSSEHQTNRPCNFFGLLAVGLTLGLVTLLKCTLLATAPHTVIHNRAHTLHTPNTHNTPQADRALCELRESIRSRQRELLIEKRKTHAPQYRPKVCPCAFVVSVCLCSYRTRFTERIYKFER